MTHFTLDTPPISLFWDAVRHTPDHGAACEYDAGGRMCGRISYSALAERVKSLAAELASRFPVGTRIGLAAPNTIDHLAAWLAIQSAGMVWVPLNPNNGRETNAKAIARAKPALILASTEQAATLSGLSKAIGAIPASLRPAPGFEPVLRTASDTMAIKFTGGSTGEPKGVIQSNRSVMANIINMAERYPASGPVVFLACAPLTHGASHFILPTLASGGRLVLTHKPDPSLLLRLMSEEAVTDSFMPPTLLGRLATMSDRPVRAPALRRIIYGAAPLPVEQYQRARRAFGDRIAGLYGQTEAPMTIAAINEAEMANPALQASVGRAGRLSTIGVVDKEGRPAGRGETGEIVVRGPLVMDGYLDDPERTASTLRRGWLHTGDLGHIDADGYVFLTGRASDMIISGGFNIHPAEVELALAGLPGVDEVCAFAMPDPQWGERLEVAITAMPGHHPNPQVLTGLARDLLGPVKTPKAVHVIARMPRNPVGKVTRSAVRGVVYPSPAESGTASS